MADAILSTLKVRQRPQISLLVRNIGTTLCENLITRALNFVVILILSRQLGPSDYGKYSFIYVMAITCSALFDFGMENTAVRFASRYKESNHAIFGLYFCVKLMTLTALVLFFTFFGGWLFTLMHKQALVGYLPYLIAGLIGESLFFVNDTYLQSIQRFQLRAILNVSRYAACLLLIASLFFSREVRLEWVFYIYFVPLLFLGFFVRRYVDFIRAYLSWKPEPGRLAEMFGYEKWMFVYSVAHNLLGRVDFFMLGLWAQFHQLGVYNAAFQLCSVVAILPTVIGKVVLPALSELTEAEIFAKTSKIIRGSLMICGTALLLVPVGSWLVPFLLGPEYIAAIPIFCILLISFIVSLMSVPYEQALYSLGKPKVLSMGRYFHLMLLVALNWGYVTLAGPSLFSYVVAWTALLGRILYLIYVRYFYIDYKNSLERVA